MIITLITIRIQVAHNNNDNNGLANNFPTQTFVMVCPC